MVSTLSRWQSSSTSTLTSSNQLETKECHLRALILAAPIAHNDLSPVFVLLSQRVLKLERSLRKCIYAFDKRLSSLQEGGQTRRLKPINEPCLKSWPPQLREHILQERFFFSAATLEVICSNRVRDAKRDQVR